MFIIAFSLRWEKSLHCICSKRENDSYGISCGWARLPIAVCLGGENLPIEFSSQARMLFTAFAKREEASPHYKEMIWPVVYTLGVEDFLLA